MGCTVSAGQEEKTMETYFKDQKRSCDCSFSSYGGVSHVAWRKSGMEVFKTYLEKSLSSWPNLSPAQKISKVPSNPKHYMALARL